MLTVTGAAMQEILAHRKIYEHFGDEQEYENLCKVRVDMLMNFKETNNGMILLSTLRTKNDDEYQIPREIQGLFSRTKQGAFVIGNLLANKHLKKIRKSISDENAIDTEMTLLCQTHGTVTKVNQSLELYFTFT